MGNAVVEASILQQLQALAIHVQSESHLGWKMYQTQLVFLIHTMYCTVNREQAAESAASLFPGCFHCTPLPPTLG